MTRINQLQTALRKQIAAITALPAALPREAFNGDHRSSAKGSRRAQGAHSDREKSIIRRAKGSFPVSAEPSDEVCDTTAYYFLQRIDQ
ncbi:MAG: hypothetical protein WA005_12270 [Candidatus Binataceae bacterium]